MSRIPPPEPCAGCAELERKLQRARKRIVAPGACPHCKRLGPGPGNWNYAPCPKCGAIEGMGLTGGGRTGTVAVWCCMCRHLGPVVEGLGQDMDRAAVHGWNTEFAAAFAEIAALRARAESAESRVSELERELAEERARLDWVEKVLSDEAPYSDVILQSDEEDGVWVALRDTGLHGCVPMDGQDAHAPTLRCAIDAARQTAERGGTPK